MSEASLRSKAALVTGGSSGMGEEIARQMAAAGAAVTLVGRNSDRLDWVVQSIRKGGGSAHAIVQDLTEPGAADRVVDAAVSAMGSLSILVNTAGIFETGPFESAPLETLDRQMAINVRAAFALTQAALPHLRRSGNASILFVSSMAAHAAFPESAAYSATKGAVEAMARQLAVELAPLGVRVNTIAPGEIDTPMNADFYRENPGFVAEMSRGIPVGRIGLASDVAPAAVFLASDAAGFVCGASLPVDGGYLAK